MQLSIDFSPPRQAQATAALEGAKREISDWDKLALRFLENHAKTHELFTGEEVTRASRELGLPQPSELRSWGRLYRDAQRAGIIVVVDQNGRRSNGSSTARYRFLIHRGEK